jgi:hypothetical protein
MPTINAYVIDDSKFDLAMFIDGKLTRGSVGIKGVADMVERVTQLCVDGRKLAELRVVGHGNEMGQYIGSDWLSLDTLPLHRGALMRLTPLFVRGSEEGRRAHLIMGGCRQGRNGGLLLAISDIVNVPVSGFTALQRPPLPGDEGGMTTCYLTCNREGQTVADRLDEVQLKIMKWFSTR